MEERGEVHDPGHVRVVEFDESRRTEWSGHHADRESETASSKKQIPPEPSA